MSAGASWSAADDVLLESLRRSESVKALAARFGRNDNAIRSRLKHLDDPEHKAYHRLRGTAPPARAAAVPPPPTSAQSLGKRSFSESASASLVEAVPEAEEVDESKLLPSQVAAVRAVDRGENVFVTGPAGTGKSFVVKIITQRLKRLYPHAGGVVITASTGIAAQHVGGVTLHSFAGVGLARNNKEALYEKLSAAARDRWTTVRALIIDEISMVDSSLLDKIEFIARSCRGGREPWGGVKLVFVGDFFQLPPVGLGMFGQKFAFQSLAWASASIRTVVLKEIVRQQGDVAFQTLLNEVRVGHCSSTTLATLQRCHESVKRLPNDGIEPTRLYCKNADVGKENLERLAQLPGPEQQLACRDEWRVYPSEGSKVEADMEAKAPAVLRLKVGAQVMLTRNMADHGLVNGSRGVVEGFIPQGGPVVRFDNGKTLALEQSDVFAGNRDGCLVRWQYPLKLAWAVTVHKSQGQSTWPSSSSSPSPFRPSHPACFLSLFPPSLSNRPTGMTLSRASMSVDDAFAEGQVYVALSRVSALAGLYLTGPMLQAGAVKAHRDVVLFYAHA